MYRNRSYDKSPFLERSKYGKSLCMVPVVIHCSIIVLKQLYSTFLYGNYSYEKSQFLEITIYGKSYVWYRCFKDA